MKSYPKTLYLASQCGQEIANVRELNATDFNGFAADITALEAFDREERLFRLVTLNHLDLLDKLELHVSGYAGDPRMTMDRLTEIHLDLNRLVMNLLSSIRTYLDHTETRLKKHKLPEYGYFQQLTAAAFDQHFAYRFLYKLRNYAQHCGLPAGSVSAKFQKKQYSLSLNLVTADLLQHFDGWGAIVKTDLASCPEEFDILPLLSEKVAQLTEINQQMSNLLLDKLSTSGDRLLVLLREVIEKKPGRPVLMSMQGTTNRANMQMRWSPLEMISRSTGVQIIFE